MVYGKRELEAETMCRMSRSAQVRGNSHRDRLGMNFFSHPTLLMGRQWSWGSAGFGCERYRAMRRGGEGRGRKGGRREEGGARWP